MSSLSEKERGGRDEGVSEREREGERESERERERERERKWLQGKPGSFFYPSRLSNFF